MCSWSSQDHFINVTFLWNTKGQISNTSSEMHPVICEELLALSKGVDLIIIVILSAGFLV